ncbi:MAG: insulinase family protein [Omnitrophica bacterium]|nr:insulinase family protein [Candidatus Omnitrophota bacterium]
MKNRKCALAFASVFIVLLGCSCRQVTDTANTEGLSSLNSIPDPTVTKEILNNGLTVLIKEEHSHAVVTVMATVVAGLSSEKKYVGTGISHFVEHMAFKGTEKRKPGSIEEEVKSMGGGINASTGLDSTNYYITVPSEYAQKALELIGDILFNPLFDSTEMEKERDVILKEIRLNRDDPKRRIGRQLWGVSYLEHPYKLPIIGYEGLLKGLKRDDLLDYHARRYVPDNIAITIAGDVDTDEILAAAKSIFKKYERQRNPLITVPREPEQNSLRELKGFARINLGYLAMGYHTVGLSSDDLYALDVLGIVLGDWDGSRLNKKIVKEDELLYVVGSYSYTPKYPGLFIISGTGDPKKLERAKEKILREVEKISREGIRADELAAAKNLVISGYISSLETTSGLAGAISQSEFLAGDPMFFKKYVDNIKKTDSDIVKNVAQKYLRKTNLTISYLYPETTNLPQSRLAGGATVLARENLPEKVTLPSGIRLILKEDRRLPKISLACAFTGGVRVENTGNNGISNLTSAMLLKGTKSRKEHEIRPFLEKKGGGIGHFSGKNSFGISMDFLTENTNGALDLFADIIKNPSFPDEELNKEKEKLYAAIKSQDDDIYGFGFLKLRKALFPAYPYGLREIGEADSLKAITRENIQDFYKKFGAPQNMIISVVGDFETRDMRREIEARLVSLTKIPFNLDIKPPAALRGLTDAGFSVPREQSLILVGFRGTTQGARHDKYALSLLSSILSGENGRLYQAVRNKAGLSYALGFFSVPGVDTGYIAAYAATDKAHLKEAKDILLEELKKVKNGAIEEEEVAMAKSSLIGRDKISLQSAGALAYRMLFDEFYETGYNAYLNYPRAIESITKEGIVKAAQKYIDLENFVIVEITGEGEAFRP